MRVLFALALTAAAADVTCDEKDEVSALQTQLGAQRLQQRAQGSATLAAFDSAMATKKGGKAAECPAKEVQAMTTCMTMGGGDHLTDVFGSSNTIATAVDEFLNSTCADLHHDLWCLRSSKCYTSTLASFEIAIPVVNETDPVYPSQLCAEAEGSADLQVACGMTPELICKTIVNASQGVCGEDDPVLDCAAATSDVDLGESSSMTVGYCDYDENVLEETAYADFMIDTKEGCQAAVESMGFPFHKSIKKWMRAKRKPLGCYLYEKRGGAKGYFNAFGKEPARASDFSKEVKRRSVCKKFA